MIDKEELRKIKIETTIELQKINVSSYKLSEIDSRLQSYVLGVINNPESHNVYEQLSVKRFFSFLDKYIFKKNKVKKFVTLYEKLRFTGDRGLTHYKLTPVQYFQFANIYGFYKTETKRLIRDGLFFVPRKFSKTTSVASVGIEDLLFGDNNGQTFVAANSYNQAKICFDVIRDILKAHDRKFRNFKINREIVYNLRPGRKSFIQCLSSSPDKLDGLNASVVIVDEYSQADSADLKNVLTSSMGARKNPLTIIITTASDKVDSPFVELLNSYKSILRGELENDAVFAHIFEPDVDDAEDDPKTWKKVQPHLGVTVQADFYEEEYKKAVLTRDAMRTFRTKLLNVFDNGSNKTWLTADDIAPLRQNIDITNLKERYECMVGVDLSVYDDFSTVTYNIYNKYTKSFHAHSDFYLPEETLKNHPNKELYKIWQQKGYLNVLPGNVIDYRRIANDIIERNKKLLILGIGYDPYKSAEFVNIMVASGAGNVMQAVRQTYGTFTSPVESLEIAVKGAKMTFNDNPIVSYCFNNAVIDEDRLGNKKPIKKSDNEKIDATITTLMTYHLFNNYTR